MNEMFGNNNFFGTSRLRASLAGLFGIRKQISPHVDEAGQTVPEKNIIRKILKGHKNERKALKIVMELFHEGAFPAAPNRYSRPFLSTPWSKTDLAGFDLFVPTDIGPVGIQIKSSYEQMDLFINEHRNGKIVPVVVMDTRKSEAWLRIDLKAAILQAYRTKKEHVNP